MKNFLLAVLCLSVALFSGCATVSPADDASIQGHWKGQEVVNGQALASWLTLSGSDVDFHGADSRDWFRGTFTVNQRMNPKQLITVISLSTLPQSAGKTVNAVYRVAPGADDQATLIVTFSQPGDPYMPASLNDRHARQIVFTKD